MLRRCFFISPLILAVSACWLSPLEIQDRVNVLDVPGAKLDTGDPVGTTPSSTTSPTDTPTSTGGGTPFDCADEDLGNAFGMALSSGDNSSGLDDHTGSCGSSPDGNDIAYVWEAPGSGCWQIGVNGEDFDDKIYVLDECGGTEIACADTPAFAKGSAGNPVVGVPLSSGDAILIVVDGASPEDAGAFSLDVRLGLDMPFADDLGSATGTYYGTTTGADDTLEPMACAYNSGADILLKWRAPATGMFRFSLDSEGTTFDSVLSLHLPCAPDALVCDDAVVPYLVTGGGETVDVTVERGADLVIRVAGYQVGHDTETGDYQLTVRRL